MEILYIGLGVFALCLFVVIIYFLTRKSNETFVVSGCESEKKDLKCPPNKKITDGNIKYGRWDNKLCPHPTVNSSTKPIFKTYPLLKYPAIVQSGIVSNSNLKDDPYGGVYKHYSVDYTCS